MCRLLGYCSRGSASVAGLLTQEGLGEFTALSAFHADGWGMAWYDADGPQVRKSARRAAEEPEYARLAQCALGDLGLVHLRSATPGLGIGYPNSHPFRFGPYTLAHNGAIHPQGRLGEMLPAEWERRLAGSTDSERYLLHIMWRLEARRGDMIAAVADTVAGMAARYAVNSLNAVLLAPAKMYMISWHDPARIPADELRKRGLASTPEEVAGYFHLACRATGDAVVVASSGWPQPGWTMLPNNTVLAVDRVTLRTSAFSLEPASRSPAGRLPAGPACTLGRPAQRWHRWNCSRPPGAARLSWCGRSLEAASGPGRPRQLEVERRNAGTEKLSQCDIPGVVGSEIVPEFPYPGGERAVGEEFHPHVEEIGMGHRRDIGGNLAGGGGPAQNVGRLDRHQMRGTERLVGEQGFRPGTGVAAIDERRHHERGINDKGHRRSSSRWDRMRSAGREDSVAAFLAWIRCTRASASGCRASSTSLARRYSCSDRPLRAARAASSSRVSSGTSRIVIDVVMHALYC